MLKGSGSIKTITEEKVEEGHNVNYVYNFINEVPFRKENSISTNWCEFIITNSIGVQISNFKDSLYYKF